MNDKIFPGNWVTNLSSYQSQSVVALPGRTYFHRVGYIKVDSTARREFDIVIPSPDKQEGNHLLGLGNLGRDGPLCLATVESLVGGGCFQGL